ncbi:O-antigen ligase family protein [Brooklawnia cerclae]|uniref:Uncharacterized protein n=1 Tax=Brooklawnia cerclae TaxID=349934 RepID=A0ABX0SIK0_9ACTN|nr:O-antigen ligase family protein [Brooklawnia cerclae]NIH56895.1 hypothetical protein [Brooklawnia cerclae]
MLQVLAACLLGTVGLLLLVTYRSDRLAALVATFEICAYILVPTFYLGPVTSLRSFLLASTVGMTIVLLARRHIASARVMGAWLYLAYFFAILTASVLNLGHSNLGLYVNAMVPGMAVLLAALCADVFERQIILRNLVLLAGLEAAYAVGEAVGVLPRLWSNTVVYPHQLVTGLTRAEGTLGHPLMLAFLLLVALSFSLRGFGSPGPMRLILVPLLLAGLFATGSRSGLVIAIIFMIFTIGRGFTRVVFGVLVFIGLVAFLVITGFFEGNVVSNFLSGDSVGHRSGALEAVPGLLTHQPFLNVMLGNGFYSASSVFQAGLLQSGTFYAIDNQFVLTLVEGGVVTVVLLASFMTRILLVGKKSRLPIMAILFFFFTFDLLAWSVGSAVVGLVAAVALSSPSGDSAEGNQKSLVEREFHTFPRSS